MESPPPRRARRRRPPRPGTAVALELARALGACALLPLRLFDYAVSRESLRAELLADLDETPELAPLELPPEDAARLPRRPLRVFLACAEASGELHALHLLEALRAELARLGAPPPQVRGFGGERLARAGVELLAQPVQRAAMGFEGMGRALPYYLALLASAARAFREAPPDVCVAVDSPALHVPLLRIARRCAVPAVHHVTPQHWGWAPWRARAYRSAVDRALAILPFEAPWFARRGVPVAHVGHPIVDALSAVPPAQPREPPPLLLALLPGSRAGVVARNLPWMLRAAARLREREPALEVVVAQDDAARAEALRAAVRAAGAEGWAAVETGLHDVLARAGAALSVSGTVLLDVLHHRLPAVVVYRVESRTDIWMYRSLLTAPWFASPNLLAGREVLPEFCFRGDGPLEAVVEAVERCLRDPAWRRRCRSDLERAAARLGPPGASSRAAVQVLAAATEPDVRRP